MKSVVAVLLAVLGCAAIWTQNSAGNQVRKGENTANNKQGRGTAKNPLPEPVSVAVEKGAAWLASVQGSDGGWGQDGGEATNVRKGVHLETKGNDVANTSIAALALLRAGDKYRPNVERALDFIMRKIDASPAEGLSITDVNQTQVQRKLGPYIDTFCAAMLLAEVDGTFSKTTNARIRAGLQKCVAKIQKNQTKDGSWNAAGGWAPVLGTALASRSLYEAGKKGVAVDQAVLARADDYTVNSQKERDSMSSGAGVGSGRGSGVAAADGVGVPAGTAASAGVALYQDAQALEQLSRTPESRQKNAKEIASINSKLADTKFVEGYGSIGGEEFFSYLNISDGLKRSGGKEWKAWQSKISEKILKLQNNDGTWAGHHCITGRVAVTSAAILNLTPDHAN